MRKEISLQVKTEIRKENIPSLTGPFFQAKVIGQTPAVRGEFTCRALCITFIVLEACGPGERPRTIE